MLVFSAIVPHPPLLVPSVGQKNLDKIKKTKTAMEKLAEDFCLAKPDVVIIISPHGELMDKAFTINTAPEFKIDFKKFGDLETELKFKGDVGLTYQIKEKVEIKTDLVMQAEENLDHGVSVPLFYLLQNCSQVKVVPMGYCAKNNAEHFELGQELADLIHNSDKRIAVIASGDLSHCLNKKAPVTYSPAGKKFDKEIIKLIEEKKISEVMKIDSDLVGAAAECGFKSIIILAGVLAEHNYEPEILSYEGPFGVGYLVCEFRI